MKKSLILLAIFIGSTLSLSAQRQKGLELSVEASAGYTFHYRDALFTGTVVGGYRFSPIFFMGLGAGVGYNPYPNDTYSLSNPANSGGGEFTNFPDRVLIPMFMRFKVNTTSRKTSVFLLADLGYIFDTNGTYFTSQYPDNLGHYGLIYYRTSNVFIRPAIGVDLQLKNGKGLSIQASPSTSFNFEHMRYYHNDKRDPAKSEWREDILPVRLEITVGYRF